MRLKVNDIILDQFEDTIIAQTFGVNEFGELQTRQGGLSNDFTIPLTGKNKLALDFPDDLNFVTRSPYKKVAAQLVDVGTGVAIGYIRYKIVTDGKSISCSFFSDNTEWFNLIKDKKMSELDLSEYDHIWEYQTIGQAIFDNKSSGYTYPIIDYGFFKDQDVSVDFDIESDRLFPAMFVSSLLEQIYKDIGWTVSGNLLSEGIYQRMIQPFSAKDFSRNPVTVKSREVNVLESGTPDLIKSGTTSAQSLFIEWNNASDTVNPLFDESYNLLASINYTWTKSGAPIDPNPVLSAAIQVNGVTISLSTNIPSGASDSGVFSFNEVNIELLQSDNIKLLFGISSGDGEGTVSFNNGSLSLSIDAEYKAGDEITMASTMPDMKQSDFLKYIFFTFGVVPQPNNYSKTIDLDLFKNIKPNIPNAKDWSSKIDLSKSYSNDFTKLLNNYSRKSRLVYKEDSNDAELSAYLAETEEIFGQGFINIDNDHLDPEKDIYEAPYSSMINIVSFNDTLYIPQIKYYQSDGVGGFSKEFEPEPKIAILSETISVEDLTLGSNLNISIIPPVGAGDFGLSNVNFCWFAKTKYIEEVDLIDWTLAYNPVLFNNNIGTGMKDAYIQDYETILSNMKFVKAWFKLDEVDIANLDFMTPIYVDKFKSYFYKNKIDDYEGSVKSTQVELIKIS